MHRLRRARPLARLVLAWLLLSLGVAVAAPLVQPHAMQLVCSAGGNVKLVVVSADGAQAPAGAHLDCPLCLPLGAPPPVAWVAPPPPALPALRPHGPLAAAPMLLPAWRWLARAPPSLL